MSPLLEEKSKLTKSGNGIIKVDHIPLDSGFYTDSEYVIKMSQIAIVKVIKMKTPVKLRRTENCPFSDFLNFF